MDSPEQLDLEAEPSAYQRGRSARWLLLLAGGVPTLGTFAGFGGHYWWALDLAAALRLQYLVVLAAVAILGMLTRSWRAVILVLIPLAVNAAVVAPLYRHPDPQARDAAPPLPPPLTLDSSSPWLNQAPADEKDHAPASKPSPLRVMNFNARPHPRTADAVLDFLRESPADLIVLQDVQPQVLEHLEYQIAPFRIQLAEPHHEEYGIAIASRVGLRQIMSIEQSRLLELSAHPAHMKAVEVQLTWMDRTLMLLAVRVVAPLNADDARVHAQQMSAIAQWVAKQQHPVIVIGSMAATPWSAGFNDLLSRTGLVNSQRGFGIQPTWPSTGSPLGQIPIDHCLHSADLVTVQRRLGPSLGTDHQALEVALWWRGQQRPTLSVP